MLIKDINHIMKPIFRHILIAAVTLIFASSIAAKTNKTSSPSNTNDNTGFPTTGYAVDPAKMEQFERSFIPFMKKWNMPGAAVVVMKNGQVLAQRGYGWADKDNKEPVMPNTLFRIASSSKTFTAVTILKLIQDGRLHPDDKVFSILSDLKPLNGKLVNPKIYQMTVQNLLQMSSGWFTPGGGHFDPLFGPWSARIRGILNPELPASCETTTRMMMSMPLRAKPGTVYVYSNLDYCILGLIVNKVTGSPYGYKGYEQYVKSQILSPIGITDMHIGSTQLKYRAPNEAHYYQDARGAGPEELANSFYLPYSTAEIIKKNFGNGGWVASAIDLATFIQALANGRILNANTLAFMQSRPAFVDKKRASYYTMGGIIYWVNGKRYWIQTGSFTGTNVLIVTKPDDTTIAVVFNSRPSIGVFLGRFRPELRKILVNSGF